MLNRILSSSSEGPVQSDSNQLPGPLRKFLISEQNNASNIPTTSSLEIESQGKLSTWFALSDSDPLMPNGLSRRQRLFGFVLCLLSASFCLCLAMVFIPLLSTPFGMRNSFSFLWGPWNHLKGLLAPQRLLFTTVFLSSLFFSLYAVLVWQSAVCAASGLLMQICSVCWQVIASIPGGRAGIGALVRSGVWTVKNVSRGLPV
ncbi:unnamed protein product [Dicrocoelium dendriticum]|nr:unnamed protein product [Dicrocoelium dendriticum]